MLLPLLCAGPLAIGISFVAAGLAAANLLLDMDWIQKASYQRLPKWMEWYGAQSLMLTLVSVHGWVLVSRRMLCMLLETFPVKWYLCSCC
jgi:uncharacterized YccA/Bax inhibitor family protein